FFSSRRRHTRSKRDWSSDVCSSDLVLGVLAGIFVLGAFSKTANKVGAYAGFIVSSIVIIYLKYNVPDVTSWSYSLITITISVIVGQIVSSIYNSRTKEDINEESTVYYVD